MGIATDVRGRYSTGGIGMRMAGCLIRKGINGLE